MLTRSKRANPVRTLNVVTRFVWTAKRGDDGRARYLQHCHAADGSHSSSARSTKYSVRRTTDVTREGCRWAVWALSRTPRSRRSRSSEPGHFRPL